VFIISEKVKVSYNLDKNLKKQLVIIAENKEINQTQLLEQYIRQGVSQDKSYLSSHLENSASGTGNKRRKRD